MSRTPMPKRRKRFSFEQRGVDPLDGAQTYTAAEIAAFPKVDWPREFSERPIVIMLEKGDGAEVAFTPDEPISYQDRDIDVTAEWGGVLAEIAKAFAASIADEKLAPDNGGEFLKQLIGEMIMYLEKNPTVKPNEKLRAWRAQQNAGSDTL